MLSTIWHEALVQPIFNVMVAFYQLTGNLGIAIILLTIAIRTVLLPIVLPSFKTIKKQRDLQPELEKLKKKYKHDKKKQAEKQMELFKKHGINPASGCLTQLPMLIVLFALFSAIGIISQDISLAELNSEIYFEIFKFSSLEQFSKYFLVWDLSVPDSYFVLPLISGFLQFLNSKMTMPYVQAGEKAAKKTPDKTDDIAYNIQEQMIYLLPIMTVIIGFRLPAGTVLYIIATSIYSIVQTYFVSGWGGLTPLVKKIKR